MSAVRSRSQTPGPAGHGLPFQVPTLGFHHVTSDFSHYTALPAERFAGLVERLAPAGFLGLGELCDSLALGEDAPEGVLVTFDDA
jgi:hypothetical protein